MKKKCITKSGRHKWKRDRVREAFDEWYRYRLCIRCGLSQWQNSV